MKHFSILLIGVAIAFSAVANNGNGSKNDSTKIGLITQQQFDKGKKVAVSFGGYARMFLHHRLLNNFEVFDSLTNNFIAPRKITFGDGFREPAMMLNTTLTSKAGATLATDFFIFTPFNGSIDGNFFTNNIMLNLYGTIPTDYGTYSVKTGGIHWYEISDFTMGSVDLNRYSIFIRTPWEGAGNTIEKYANYYDQGTINLDERFTSQAFKGLILEGADIPGNLSFNFLFGKNASNLNDITVLPEEVPNYTVAGKIEHVIKDNNRIGLNTINSISLDDINNANKAGFNMLTFTHRWFIKKALVSGEAGLGSFFSPTYERQWDPGAKIKFSIPEDYTYLPMDFEFFYIGPNFTNNIGAFSNTSISQLLFLGRSETENSQSTILQPFASPITNVGFMTNNRWGFHYNTEADLWGLKLNLGYSLAQEINQIGNDISVSHRINGLTLSRLYFFQANRGPYERLGTFFRGGYEVVNVPGMSPDDRKSFNTIELQAKYDWKIKKRHIYAFYFGSLNSVQNKLAVGPYFSDQAWLRAYFNEVEIYVQAFPKVFLSGYFGFEQIKGNMDTRLNVETGAPIDQFNHAYGVGMDIDIAKNTGLFIRQRWFNQEDRNFPDARLFGTETEIEMKVFF